MGIESRRPLQDVATAARTILILDEAASALHSESEVAIQDKLDRIIDRKTVIAIAHRLSTIARMDRIAALDQGRIIEEGRALSEKGGLFPRFEEGKRAALFLTKVRNRIASTEEQAQH